MKKNAGCLLYLVKRKYRADREDARGSDGRGSHADRYREAV